MAEAPAAIKADSVLEPAPPVPSVASEWQQAGHDTLRPSHVESPSEPSGREFRTGTPRRAWLVAAIVASLAGAVGLVVIATRSEPDPVATLPPAPPPIATPARPSPAPPRATVKPPSTAEAVATPATSSEPADEAETAGPAPADTEQTVPVTVRVSPHHAVLFKEDRRFGTGEVTLNVVPGTKTTLVARLGGYEPRVLVIDGRYTSVNIALKPREWAPTPAPRAEPSAEATPSTPKPEPATPAPARSGEPSPGASKTAPPAAVDAPAPLKGASDTEPSKPSPSVSASKVGSDRVDGVESP
jgi:hypothetical protein